MKGLLIKDLMLMKNQKGFFVALLVALVYIPYVLNDALSAMGYMTFIFCIFVVNTISYDEFDNGYAFLFTLPFSRRGYAAEKYLFGLLGCVAGVLLEMALYCLAMRVKGADFAVRGTAITAMVFISIGFIVLSFGIPFQIKYGNAKFSMSIAVVCMVVAVIGYALSTLPVFETVLLDMMRIIGRVNKGVLAGVFLLFSLVVMFVSFLICVRMLEGKEL